MMGKVSKTSLHAIIVGLAATLWLAGMLAGVELVCTEHYWTGYSVLTGACGAMVGFIAYMWRDSE